ncbi:MAG: trypsin-like serine protease [Deltaproteobacteria bacterium]|nr:trypsin-like serine protease [Deltaproteobacteria bacterium]
MPIALLPLLSFALADLPPPPDITAMPLPPTLVVGGQVADVCEWPSTVQLATQFGEPFCTGTLLDERTVVTAAHCIDPQFSFWSPDQIMFGESSSAPALSTPISSCTPHPLWDPGDGNPGSSYFYDLAVCTLSQDAPDVPIVPPLMGCEASALVPGAEMTIVGFGTDNENSSEGGGTKRWVVNTIETVDLASNDLTLLGTPQGGSACFGDSGGPVFIELPDGSWRVSGVTSTAHPSVWGQSPICGFGVVYDMIHTQMEWFETQTGRDLTPCHDADGTWNPDERCDAFPMDLQPAGAAWASMCDGGQISGPGASCGDPFQGGDPTETGGETEGDTDGDTDTEGPDDTTGSDTEPGTTGGSGPLDPSTGTAPGGSGSSDSGPVDPPGGTGSSGGASETGELPADDDGDSGCGCRQSSPGGSALALFGLVLGVATRRRRRVTSSR